MKKVLIIWPWKQGKKYINYFSNSWYIIYTVSKKNTPQDALIYKNSLYTDFKKSTKKDLEAYSYIIVSVAPILEQEKVINDLLELNLNNKIIIEKPIAKDIEVIKKVSKSKNTFLFIDELILSTKIIKHPPQKVDIFASTYDVFDHAIWIFLWQDLSNTIIKIHTTRKYWNDLNYKIYIDNDTMQCKRWFYYLNEALVHRIDFKQSLEFVLNLTEEESQLMKKNFLDYIIDNY